LYRELHLKRDNGQDPKSGTFHHTGTQLCTVLATSFVLDTAVTWCVVAPQLTLSQSQSPMFMHID